MNILAKLRFDNATAGFQCPTADGRQAPQAVNVDGAKFLIFTKSRIRFAMSHEQLMSGVSSLEELTTTLCRIVLRYKSNSTSRFVM